MIDPVKKKPEDWLKEEPFTGILVMDPDGWDRKNYQVSWNEEITKEEMHKRLGVSTCMEVIRDDNKFRYFSDEPMPVLPEGLSEPLEIKTTLERMRERDAKRKAKAVTHAFVVANLRHAYEQLAAGTVKNQKEFADGLIAPAIRYLKEKNNG